MPTYNPGSDLDVLDLEHDRLAAAGEPEPDNPEPFPSVSRAATRKDAPDTSRQAAQSLDPYHLQKQAKAVYDVIWFAGSEGATMDEIAVTLGLLERKSGVSARLNALYLGGLIRRSGITRPGRSGRPQHAWVKAVQA